MMNRKLIAAAVMAALCPPVYAMHDSQQASQNSQSAQQQDRQKAEQHSAQQQQAQDRTPRQSANESNQPRVISAGAPNYTISMERLLDASQRLRQAIQALAQQEVGPGRDRAIEAAHNALFDAQQAMVALPPELRTGTGSEGAANESRALDRLRQAADYFRESIQAMAQQPSGPGRNQAARSALEGLLETQMAMINLPSVTSGSSSQSSTTSRSGDASRSQATQQQSERSAASADGTSVRRSTSTLVLIEPVGPRSAQGGQQSGRHTQRGGAASFASLDRDGDGAISMAEATADPDTMSRFADRDTDRDYRLSRSEWDAGEARDQQARTSSSVASRAKSGTAASGGQVLNPTTFEQLDRDNDGYIGMMEAAADPDATSRFKERDLNRDYRLSRSEWENTKIDKQDAAERRTSDRDPDAKDVTAMDDSQRNRAQTSR